jgi:RNA polymerase sigma-70 factor (ECF subfamily)
LNPPPPSPEPAWKEAVERARNGDEAAAVEIVHALHGPVLRIVRSHLPRGADEEDLVQEVFMKVFGGIDGFLGLQPFPNWVARIALNTCYDHLRRQRTRPEVRFSDLDAEDLRVVESLVAGKDAPAADGMAVVEKLLATLNPREQMILRLLDLEKRPLREVCALTGWGLSRVKVAAMRARRKLNANLKRLEGDRT